MIFMIKIEFNKKYFLFSIAEGLGDLPLNKRRLAMLKMQGILYEQSSGDHMNWQQGITSSWPQTSWQQPGQQHQYVSSQAQSPSLFVPSPSNSYMSL